MSSPFSSPSFQPSLDFGLDDSDPSLADPQSSFEALCDRLTNGIRSIRQILKKLNKALEIVGSPNDGPNIRKHILNYQSSLIDLQTSTHTDLTDLLALNGSTKDIRLRQLNFQKEFETIEPQLISALNNIDHTLIDHPLPTQSTNEIGIVPTFGATSSDMKRSSQMGSQFNEEESARYNKIQLQVETNDMIISERTQDIEQIVQDINDVNYITGELATLVDSQTASYQTIQTNSEDTEYYTNSALNETIKASKSQRSYRNKICYMLICSLVLTGIVVLLVVFSLPQQHDKGKKL